MAAEQKEQKSMSIVGGLTRDDNSVVLDSDNKSEGSYLANTSRDGRGNSMNNSMSSNSQSELKQKAVSIAAGDINEAKADENLDLMKARAGYELVETIAGEDGRATRILYLTNKQALHISSDLESMENMIKTVCGNRKHYLIIDLVQSWGFYNSTRLMDKSMFAEDSKWNAGIDYKITPFKDLTEEQETLSRIDIFMLKVIIPLAEKTSAIVLYNAVTDDCILAECFINMVDSMSSRWNGEPPFAAVGTLSRVEVLYRNPNKSTAVWRKIMNRTTIWRKRHEGILEKYYGDEDYKKKNKLPMHHDLNVKSRGLLIIEGLDTQVDQGFQNTSTDSSTDSSKNIRITSNREPSAALITALMRHIGKNVPQLAIKTGACVRDNYFQKHYIRGIQQMSLRMLLERVNFCSATLCIDVRNRQKVEGGRPILGKNEKEDFDEISKKLDDALKSSTEPVKVTSADARYNDCESLDICVLAYLHKLLTEKKDKKKQEVSEQKYRKSIANNLSFRNSDTNISVQSQQQSDLPPSLQETIDCYKTQGYDYKSTIDYSQYANMYASKFFKHLYDAKKEKPDKDEKLFFNAEIKTASSCAMQLLMSKRFHQLNIWDNSLVDQIEFIDDLVLNSETTAKSSYEGLELLAKAWDAVDSARDIAYMYRYLYRILFYVQLYIGFSLTTFAVLAGSGWFTETTIEWCNHVVLWMSLALGAIVSLDTLLSPRAYWQHLQRAQAELESTIWKYRMRVGQFAVDKTRLDEKRPEANLREALERWKLRLVAGANNPSATRIHDNRLRQRPWFWRVVQNPKKPTRYTVTPIGGNDNDRNDPDNPDENNRDEQKNPDRRYDDHFSSLDGHRYIHFRVGVILKKYNSELPTSIMKHYRCHIAIVALGIGIAIVSAQVGESQVVAIISAVVAFLTSVIEFENTVAIADLYSSAVTSCEIQVARWTELNRFKAQSRESTTELVEEVERIVMQVVASLTTAIVDNQHSKQTNIGSNGMPNNNNNQSLRELLPQPTLPHTEP